MIRKRDDVYQVGFPAPPGKHYRNFVRFAKAHAGATVLDLGCGFGAYSKALRETGLNCTGCDINLDYLRVARSHDIPVVAVDSRLPFADGSFDTVVLFEVLEHIADFDSVIREAFRVARRNVLVTVPNAEDIELMQANDVTYAHMLAADHLNFFDLASLQSMLGRYGGPVTVERSDPIYPYWFVGRSAPFYGLRLLYRLGLLKPRFFSRLYAVASVRQN